jgi:S1-C subfamily serine protease
MIRGCNLMSAVAWGVMSGLLLAPQTMAQPANRSKEGAGVVVEGVVRELFRSTRPGGVAYLVQIDVVRSELGRGYRGAARLTGAAPGEPLYIRLESPGPEGRGLSNENLRMPLPEQRASIRAFINPRSQGGWENACPDWYEPIGAGDVAENPRRAPATVPGREAQTPDGAASPLDIIGVAAEQVQASGRLVFKVNDVREGTPAAKAGIEKGDAIVGLDGAPITSLEEFAAALNRAGPAVKLIVLNTRNGQPVVVPLDLTPASGATAGARREPAPVSRPRIGIRGEPVRLGGVGLRTGVKITNVQPDSPGQKAGLEVGDVIVSANGAAVSNLEAIEAASKAGGPILKVNVRDSRTGREVPVEIALGEDRPAPAAPGSTPTPATSVEGVSLKSLGVSVEAATVDSPPLVKVVRVTAGSPAEDAGIKPGDAILAVNGSVVFAPDLLEDALKTAGPSLTLTVLDSRTGKKNQLKINLPR